MPRLTIIIPSVGPPTEFEDTLASILQHRPADCEVVVARNERYDDPYQLAGEVAFPVFEHAKTEIELLNAAVEFATTDLVHNVLCGVEVEEGWTTEPVFQLSSEPAAAAVAPVWVRDGSRRARWHCGLHISRAGGVRHVYRRRPPRRRPAGITAPSLVAGFYRRETWLAVGGMSARYPAALAPLEFGLKLKYLGGGVDVAWESRVFGNPTIMTASGGFANGRGCEWLRRGQRIVSKAGWPQRQVARWATVAREPTWGGRLAHAAGMLRGMLDRRVEQRWSDWCAELKAAEPETIPLPVESGDEAGAGYATRRAA